MRDRKGFLLIEVMAVMGLLAVLGSLVIVVIVEMLHLAKRHEQWVALTERSFSVAEMLRNDVSNARELSAGGGKLTIVRGDGRRVTYETEGGALHRLSDAGGGAGKFSLGAVEEARWEIAQSGGLVRADLVLTAKGTSRVVTTFPFRIVARVEGEGR
ncbi:MAG: type II secretion system protein [Planctomycetota bacterium]